MMVAVLITAMVASAADYNPQVRQKVNGVIGYAWNGESMLVASVTIDDRNLVYNIFDKDFNVTESFTLYGVVKYRTNTDYEGNVSEVLISKYNYLPFSGTVGSGNCIAAKDIFTSDNQWCCFVEENLADRSIVEFRRLYKEDGTNLGLLPYHDQSSQTFGSQRLMLGQDDNSPFYCLTLYDHGNVAGYEIWDFKGSSTGVYSPQVRTVLSGYPNPLPKGESFTVELPKVSDGRTVVVVTDMSGRQVYRESVAQGLETVRITPDSVADGMLIYTVIYGDGETVSGKLIAK